MVKNSEMGYKMVKDGKKQRNGVQIAQSVENSEMGYKMVKYGKKQRNGVQNGEIEQKIAKWGTVGSRVSSSNPFFFSPSMRKENG